MQILNQTGLVFNLIGVAGLFFYGLPSKIRDTAGDAILWSNKPDEEINKIDSNNKKIKKIANYSFVLILIGIILQLLSTFL